MTKPNPSAREEVARRLKMARETAGLSQGQVARRLDMHRPTISEIEAGRRRVTAEEITLFAQLYGVDANWIIGGSDQTSGDNDKIVLAARHLSKLKEKDIDKLMDLLQMLRGTGVQDEKQ